MCTSSAMPWLLKTKLSFTWCKWKQQLVVEVLSLRLNTGGSVPIHCLIWLQFNTPALTVSLQLLQSAVISSYIVWRILEQASAIWCWEFLWGITYERHSYTLYLPRYYNDWQPSILLCSYYYYCCFYRVAQKLPCSIMIRHAASVTGQLLQATSVVTVQCSRVLCFVIGHYESWYSKPVNTIYVTITVSKFS